jgi:large subunit ribosomal protein L28
MALKCDYCGKSIAYGNSIARRGKAKYLGGVGRKITGITRRKFKPNIQRIRVLIGNHVERRRVCTKCLRSGVVKRPVVHKPFTVRI